MRVNDDMVAEESAHSPAPLDDWPELLSSPVFLVREGGHWSVVLTKFSIVGVGETPAEAWKQMDELAHDYLELCQRDRLRWRDVVRPLPLRTRLALRSRQALRDLIFLPVRPRVRERRAPHGGSFVMPHVNGGHVHAC